MPIMMKWVEGEYDRNTEIQNMLFAVSDFGISILVSLCLWRAEGDRGDALQILQALRNGYLKKAYDQAEALLKRTEKNK